MNEPNQPPVYTDEQIALLASLDYRTIETDCLNLFNRFDRLDFLKAVCGIIELWSVGNFDKAENLNDRHLQMLQSGVQHFTRLEQKLRSVGLTSELLEKGSYAFWENNNIMLALEMLITDYDKLFSIEEKLAISAAITGFMVRYNRVITHYDNLCEVIELNQLADFNHETLVMMQQTRLRLQECDEMCQGLVRSAYAITDVVTYTKHQSFACLFTYFGSLATSMNEYRRQIAQSVSLVDTIINQCEVNQQQKRILALSLEEPSHKHPKLDSPEDSPEKQTPATFYL